MTNAQESSEFSFDEVIGRSRGEMVSYFGNPEYETSHILLFQTKGGRILLLQSENRISGYGIYSSENVLIYASYKPVNLPVEKKRSFAGVPLGIFVQEFGKPHADIGSGIPLPVYLSDHGSLYTIHLVRNRIQKISEIFLDKLDDRRRVRYKVNETILTQRGLDLPENVSVKQLIQEKLFFPDILKSDRVIVVTAGEELFGFNAVAAIILESIENGESKADCVAAIASLFGAERKQIEKDYDGIISLMVDKRIIIMVDKEG